MTMLLDYVGHGGAPTVVQLARRYGLSLRKLLDIVERLKNFGMALVSLEEWSDTASAAGELVLHAFGAITQFERRLIAERTWDGIATPGAEGASPTSGARLGR